MFIGLANIYLLKAEKVAQGDYSVSPMSYAEV